MTSPALDEPRKNSLRALCQNRGVELCILFGSGARGALRDTSDLDLALQFEAGETVSKLSWIARLETVLFPWTVDLVVLTVDTPPLLLHEIFSHGKLIFEKTEGLFDAGRLRAWHLYVDSAPLRERTREFVLRKLRDLGHVS